MVEELLYGRQLLENELPVTCKVELEKLEVQKLSGTTERKGRWYCRRCSSEVTPMTPSFCQCGDECGYCTECIQMGKIKRCSTLYHLPEPNHFQTINQPLEWRGTLSDQQETAAEDIIQSILNKEIRLIWAVAGAGKTEMLFNGIAIAIERGYRIGIASPRVDVCLELFPRLQAAFPRVPISLLYGDMEESYHYRQLTIATTHQLMRFKEAFDVLIIDEIDAFPFDVDQTLQVAAIQARKKESSLIYLSATPNRLMQKEIKKGKLLATILPARYHGHPLPVPVCRPFPKWKSRLLKKHQYNKILAHMNRLILSNKRFLVFIPNIEWCHQWEAVLKEVFKTVQFECVHSSDVNRKEKVMRMRNEELAFLVSTTILERGVTFSDIDVIVIGADDAIFTESSLVQISGRAGRSPKFPTGAITFYYETISLAMKRAIKQIKHMNKTAKKRGLLNE